MELEKIDPFESTDEHLLNKANKEEVKLIKLKAKHIEDLIQELILQIEAIFEDA